MKGMDNIEICAAVLGAELMEKGERSGKRQAEETLQDQGVILIEAEIILTFCYAIIFLSFYFHLLEMYIFSLILNIFFNN
jgi:hypothetical protein